MALRDALLSAGRKAAEVLDAAEAKRRAAQGYTRIDPFAIAAMGDVPVMVRPLDRLLGAFLREDRPGILVNGERPIGMIHMTCAHELGHFYLGHETTMDRTIDYGSTADLQERQADWFGYMLLMPRWLLSKLMRMNGWNTNSLLDSAVLYQLSLRLGMSYTGVVWSLCRQNLISLVQAQNLVRVQPIDIKQQLAPEPLEDPSKQDVWLLNGSDRDLVLEPRANDKFVIDLPTRASAGYLWSVHEAQREGFQLSPLLTDGSLESRDAHLDAIGGQSLLRYSLENSNAETGRTRLTFHESQPWQAPSYIDPTFELTTEFEAIFNGLTPESKASLINGVAGE